MDGQVRRSGRRRTTTTRYVDDASNLLESLGSEGSSAIPTDGADEGDTEASEADFAVEPNSASDESFEDPHDDAASPEDVPMLDEGSDLEHARPRKVLRMDRRHKLRSPTRSLPNAQHIRGLAGLPKLTKPWEVSRALLGADEDEQERLTLKLDLWFQDPVFPVRSRIVQDNREGEDATTNPWSWYNYDGGRECFTELQTLDALSNDEGQQYYPPRHPVHKAVLGPHWQEQMFHLALNEPVHLAETWKPAPIPPTEDAQDTFSPLEHNAWILNLGAKIQSLSWAPLRNHSSQYLAVALDHPEPERGSLHTAFEPSVPFKSCIQVWSFRTNSINDTSATLDPHEPPVLVHVVCAEWGMCKEVKWCPVPFWETGNGPETHLGLLASIWSDGYVRVLDIRVPPTPSSGSLYVKYEKAAFAARPPKAVCSVASWSSPVDLVVGCSNGKIAAWDIAKTIEKQVPPKSKSMKKREMGKVKKHSESTIAKDPVPYLLHQLHDTYILAMEHCLPSYPWLLITLSANGTYRLCDLRNPSFDTTESRRYRVYPSTFDFCPHLLEVVAADSYSGVNLLPLRNFGPEILGTNCNARVSSIACGRAHAHSLVGLVDGTVLAFNTVPRTFKDMKSRKRWERVWFKHEWRPEEGLGSNNGIVNSHTTVDLASETEEAREAPDDGTAQSAHGELREGVSRITEAFEPYLQSNTAQPKADKNHSASTKSGASKWETIFEEPSAITQLQWNPNIQCGGWAAAGMGSGLLRVEDLAI